MNSLIKLHRGAPGTNPEKGSRIDASGTDLSRGLQETSMKSPREIQAVANILGGVPILGVVPGSPAERSGLRYGDIVLSLNGVATDSFEAFLCAHDTNSGELAIEVFRDGALLAFMMSVPRRRAEKAPPADASMC
jgi:S1-C subfamily serine protease